MSRAATLDRSRSPNRNSPAARGTMTVTTASGKTFTCGDGTGDPVAVRFLTHKAERRILANPAKTMADKGARYNDADPFSGTAP